MPLAGTTSRVSCSDNPPKRLPANIVIPAIIWNTVHLPFIMAYVLAGASLSRLVLATDCGDANAEDWTEA